MGQLVVNGLALGSIYALVALGLLLIFNTVQIVNFAQGQLLMVGAFIGVTGAVTNELPIGVRLTFGKRDDSASMYCSRRSPP